MSVKVSGVERNQRLEDLLIDLRNQLVGQPSHHDVTVRVESLRGNQVGVVEYRYDYFEGGRLQSAHQVQYWYVGRVACYVLAGTTPADSFDRYRGVFGTAAQRFAYLR